MVGVCWKMDDIMHYGPKTKRDIHIMDMNKKSIKLALWDGQKNKNYATSFNEKYLEGVVVVLDSKVNTFKSVKNLSGGSAVYYEKDGLPRHFKIDEMVFWRKNNV